MCVIISRRLFAVAVACRLVVVVVVVAPLLQLLMLSRPMTWAQSNGHQTRRRLATLRPGVAAAVVVVVGHSLTRTMETRMKWQLVVARLLQDRDLL